MKYISLLCLISTGLSAMYTYELATPSDVPSLLDLVNKYAVNDAEKIVILPKLFREAGLRSAIEKARLFVARHDGKPIAYKKLYVVPSAEKKELEGEIRCSEADLSPVCIYNGGDFTQKDYRGKGVNQQLTGAAFSALRKHVKQEMRANQLQHVALVYGVTKANAGRTKQLDSAFKEFLASIGTIDNRQFKGYPAFMPTFDPESSECRPLADEHSVAGFGCVLTYEVGLHE